MRNAETLLGIIRDRGKRGLPLERVYRLLFNRDLYLLAYGKIARNRGAMTPGATTETADGTSLAKIDAIIEAVRFERYRWTPSSGRTSRRRTGNGVRSDCRLVGQTAAGGAPLILDAYYDPQFSEHSHGSVGAVAATPRCARCTTAWPGTAWFLELDVAFSTGWIIRSCLASSPNASTTAVFG